MSFAEWTSLPDLHPAVVHFPIALLVTALGIDSMTLVFRRWTWLDRAAAMLWILGAAAAGAAYLTGRIAADNLGLMVPAIESAIARHADAAWWTLLGAAAVAALRFAVAWIARVDERIGRLRLRAVALTLSMGVVGLTAVTADRGGALVYRHGVAVDLATYRPEPAAEPREPEHHQRMVHLDGGGLVWSPRPEDGARLSEFVELVVGLPGSIRDIEPMQADGEGLPFQVDGQAILLVPGEFGDVQVRTVLDLADFTGTAGVVHHYLDAGSFGLFEAAETASRLIARRDGASKILATGRGRGAKGVVAIAVSAVGSHFKGFIDDMTVAHGHAAAPIPGRTGILLEGTGVVRVREIRIESGGDH